LLQKRGQTFKKIRPIFVILEDHPAFDFSEDDMVQCEGRINAGWARHGLGLHMIHIGQQ